eukprot:scaffold1020_cov182-Alexandrium_tamarense.AAC.16
MQNINSPRRQLLSSSIAILIQENNNDDAGCSLSDVNLQMPRDDGGRLPIASEPSTQCQWSYHSPHHRPRQLQHNNDG